MRERSATAIDRGRASHSSSATRRPRRAIEDALATELAMAWSARSQLHIGAGEAGEALVWAEKALSLSRARALHEAEAHALANLGAARIQLGDERGWALLEESLRTSLARGQQEEAARALASLVSLSVEERRHEAAARWLREAIALASERDLLLLRHQATAWRTRLHLAIGRWDEAAEDAALLVDDPGVADGARVVALASLGLVRARRGDANAWRPLDEALVLARRSNDTQQRVPVAAARAELAWLEGDAPRARAEVADLLERAARQERAWYVGELGGWSRRAGGAAPAARMARPFALQVAGDWRAAAQEFERLGCRYEAALATREGDDPAALLRALATLDRLAARPAAARLRRRLSELGVRSMPRARLAPRREHPFQLTAREQEVLDAMALGLSNMQIGQRLFVSPKTVDHHVSAILSKLSVPSRGVAVAEARRHGLLRTGDSVVARGQTARDQTARDQTARDQTARDQT